MTEAPIATPSAYAQRLVHHTRNALIAARDAGDIASELLRFHVEGPVCNWPFGDLEVVAKAAEVILRVARIEGDLLEEQPSAADYRSSLNQLAGAAAKFLDDQCNPDPMLLSGEIPESEVPF